MSTATMHRPVSRSQSIRYGLLFALLLAALLTVLLIRVVNHATSGSATQTQQHTNSASDDSTKSTDAPTKDTNTPADRTVPSTSGGNANTILNPGTQQ
jgi:hypothetical protein